MSNREILTALSPCLDGLDRAAESSTVREWWETSTTRSDMMWLVGSAHSQGTLQRRRLVHVAVRCAETIAHLMPPASLPLLADLSAWTHGADDVDIVQVRNRLWKVRYAAAAIAAAAAVADDADAAAYTVDDAIADATDANVAADAAICDVIRDAIGIDEVCAALGLDPDQGVV
jgi:hypothetical protein